MLELAWRFRRGVLPVCTAAIVLGVLFYGVRVWRQDGYSDFLVYYQTSQRMLSGQWSQIYRVDDHYNMFRYNPMVLPLFWPWAAIGHQVSRELFFALNVGAALFGFFAIGKALFGKVLRPRDRFVLVLSAALTLRFFLDGLWMGQVVGIMFGALGGYLWALSRGSASAAGLALWLPSGLKVGFAVLAPLCAFRGLSFLARVGMSVLGISLASAILVVLGAGLEKIGPMLHAWNLTLDTVLTPDSVLYWDSKDFRTQAINSALIRMAAWGWFDVKTAFYTWKALGVLGIAALGSAWIWALTKVRPKTPSARILGLLVSLGVMAYLLLMPWTYRHTLALLALPITVLLTSSAPAPRSFTPFWFAFLLTFSFGGSLFFGERLAFWIQEASLPVLVMIWMTALLFKELRREILRPSALRS